MSLPIRIPSKKPSGYSDNPFYGTLDSRNISMRRIREESGSPRRRSSSSGEGDTYLRRNNAETNLHSFFPRSPVRSNTTHYEQPPRRDPFRAFYEENKFWAPRSISGERPDPREDRTPNRDPRLAQSYRGMAYEEIKAERTRRMRERGYGEYSAMNQVADLQRRRNNVETRDFAYSPKRRSPSGSGRR